LAYVGNLSRELTFVFMVIHFCTALPAKTLLKVVVAAKKQAALVDCQLSRLGALQSLLDGPMKQMGP
jgi:hypothetical protein